jgi:hypothetical protein
MENSFENLNKAAKSLALTTATVLVLQAAPNSLFAQSGEKAMSNQGIEKPKGVYAKLTGVQTSKVMIVGINNGTPVYKNDKGEFFSLNSSTGDLVFIKPEDFAAFHLYQKGGTITSKSSLLMKMKFANTAVQSVTILGFDKEGHSIQRNSRGETYYVHPNTGDLVFVKF